MRLTNEKKNGSDLRFKAFTLIELLVVISIIALLLAILIPSLKLAKQKAATAVCLTNTKNLSLAWYMYQGDNDGKLVGGNMSHPSGWIRKPETADGTQRQWWYGGEVTDEDEQRGIRKGTLFSYYKSVDLLHCPADNIRRNFFYPPDSKAFASYVMADCLNGRGASGTPVLKRFGQIRNPSGKYTFVESAEERPYNGEASFIMGISQNSQSGWYETRGYFWTWWAPVAVNHGDSSTFGFADGHGEVRKWRDRHTIERVKERLIQNNGTYGHDQLRPADQIEDIGFMARGWSLGR